MEPESPPPTKPEGRWGAVTEHGCTGCALHRALCPKGRQPPSSLVSCNCTDLYIHHGGFPAGGSKVS